MKRIFLIATLLPAVCFSYNWREGEEIPTEGLKNPYGWTESELTFYRTRGLAHALEWPVDVTGVLVPERPFRKSLKAASSWLGLHKYPASEGEGAYYVPFPDGTRPNFRMGYSRIQRNGVTGVTFSCAACHSANLFGKRVMGLTNRFPRANSVYVHGVKRAKQLQPELFQKVFLATDAETNVYRQTHDRLKFVEAKEPTVLGLDTSLAHVALSMSHRAPDAWATLDPYWTENPRPEILRHKVADSKPAVWWNVKYKNKWLLDGSVVSGNPILTNLLWNEIGRGTDLIELDQWFKVNHEVIRELTTAVYAAEPPRIEDFIAAEKIDISSAKRGEVLFNQRCAKCHGTYEKAWSESNAASLSVRELIRTVRFNYHSDTPVVDVGTDSLRNEGMHSLVQLNDLQISKEQGIFIRVQKGYVPPPLLGIWARYPYLHNNSIPNLCELLLPAQKRLKTYWAGPADNIGRDFDLECNGYPTGSKTPVSWKLRADRKFNVNLPGLSNLGHDRDMDSLTNQDRKDLIKYLQTL